MHQRTVLLIAFEPWEVEQTRCTFEEVGLHVTLQVVSDAVEALAYLHRESVYTNLHHTSPPDIVIFGLPQLHELTLLQHLKRDPQCKHLPIIVFASSLCPDEARQIYEAGANAYLHKPEECSRFREVLGHLGRFWLETVELPSDI